MNKKFYVVTGVIFLMLNLASAIRGQSALDGFDPNADWFVRAVAVQPDGKILIGGEFTFVHGIARNRIARLNPDGSLDNTFNFSVTGSINCVVNVIVVQPNNQILIGGDFTTISGVPRNNIARLNANGIVDTDFNPNANGVVSAIARQSNGKILAGGSFTSIGSQARNRIARLDGLTGAADSFNPNPSAGVNTIVVEPDGRILVGGGFTNIAGLSRSRIARLDESGAADSFNPSPNGFSGVQEIAVQPDGKILAGGDFTNIGGQPRNCIARLDPVTGAADSFNPNPDNVVNVIALQPDGKVLIGGDFGVVGGITTFMARLDPVTGAPEAAFNPGFNERVVAIGVQSDGKIIAGGFFTTVAGLTRNRIARLETNGSLDRTMDLNIAPSGGVGVYTSAVQPDGKILIGGVFSSVLGVTRNNIARLNVDGTLDTAFNPNADGSVYSLAIQADGKIFAGGTFTNIGGQALNSIARLDAATGAPDSFYPNANGGIPSTTVNTIAVQADGKILVGGVFTTIGGQPRARLARLNPDGTADSFNPNVNGSLFSIAVQPDDKILVGGFLFAVGGLARGGIARLNPDGTVDSFNPNVTGGVYSIALQADGKILVGGDFTSVGGLARNRIARIDAETGQADSFNPNSNGIVNSIAVQGNGKILVGGYFSTLSGTPTIGGQTRNHIARLDANTGLADSFNPNANREVSSLALQADGKLLVGGLFTTMGGQPRDSFARLSNDDASLQYSGAVLQTTVVSSQGGSSPKLSRVTFESSTDGVNYNFLGNGTVTGGGWNLTGLSLPTGQNLYIRTRGFYRGGQYNGSESITESVRIAFFPIVPGLSGTVTYGNAAAPPKYISNATVSGAGSPNVFTTSAAPGGTAGQYSLTGFGAGSYTVSLSKTTGLNGITSNDAARVAQHVANTGPGSFTTNNQRVTADVTGNGAISSQDAAKIAQFVASLPVSPPNLTGQWRFFVPPGPTFPVGSSPTSRTYPSVTNNITGDDYVGLLIGEVTGNWNNTGARPVRSRQMAVGSGPERTVGVDFPEIVTPDKEFVVPINVNGVANKGVISYEFDLRYDPTVIQPQATAADLAGTVSRGLSVVTNTIEPGLLRVVVYGPMPISYDGVLLNLRFSAVGKPGSVSPLMWERVMFNEGEPRVNTTDGRVELF